MPVTEEGQNYPWVMLPPTTSRSLVRTVAPSQQAAGHYPFIPEVSRHVYQIECAFEIDDQIWWADQVGDQLLTQTLVAGWPWEHF